MSEFFEDLELAGEGLTRLVEGPGLTAAETLETAFGQAGDSIERALSKAARSGELEFSQMAESILADLAKILAEAIFAQSRVSQIGQSVTMNMSFPEGQSASPTIGAAGSIASYVAAAAARGARYA